MNVVVIGLILLASFYLIFMLIAHCVRKNDDVEVGLPKDAREQLSSGYYEYEYVTDSGYLMPSGVEFQHGETIKSGSSVNTFS